MKTTLYIQNFKCGGPETIIINRLSEIEAITNITIKLQYATITFEHKKPQDVENVKEALTKIGYPPFGEKNSFGKKVKSYESSATVEI